MKKNLKYVIVGVILLLLAVGYFFYLNNKTNVDNIEEETTGCYAAQKLINKNVAKDYPPTPKEVVKFYADIIVCLYSEDYSDKEFEQLADKLREICDDELNEANPREQYLNNLKAEINGYRNQGVTVSSYSTSASTDVDFFTQDGFDFARLNLALTFKQGNSAALNKEIFLLRRDTSGHYKIFGWVEDKEEK